MSLELWEGFLCYFTCLEPCFLHVLFVQTCSSNCCCLLLPEHTESPRELDVARECEERRGINPSGANGAFIKVGLRLLGLYLFRTL